MGCDLLHPLACSELGGGQRVQSRQERGDNLQSRGVCLGAHSQAEVGKALKWESLRSARGKMLCRAEDVGF